jgi:hypothetical protein
MPPLNTVALNFRAWEKSAPNRQAPPNWADSTLAVNVENCRQALAKLTELALPAKVALRPSIFARLLPL